MWQSHRKKKDLRPSEEYQAVQCGPNIKQISRKESELDSERLEIQREEFAIYSIGKGVLLTFLVVH